MKHTVAFLPSLILLVIARLFSACECEELSPVTPEGTPDPFLVTLASGSLDTDIFMSVNFNKNIDTTSVVAGISVLVEGLSSIDLFKQANRIVISGPGTNCANGTCRVRITIKGIGPNAVKSSSGQVLDGDADGTPGGDYVVELIVD